MKIAGCVILYNPLDDVVDNISSYLEYVDKLYIFDNSEYASFREKFDGIDKCCYISENKNLGIAYALNYCARLCIRDGYNWMLTMDQDSRFNVDLSEFFNMTNLVDDDVAIIAPKYDMGGFYQSDNFVVMTSGNLINLDIYEKIGGFKDYLFIDMVDYEYCLNLRKNGYDIKTCDNISLKHNLGNIESKKIFGKVIYFTNHSPFRRYYITRNRYILNRLYSDIFPVFCRRELCYNKRELVKILLFESSKMEKLLMIRKAKIDYRKWCKEYEETK